MFTIRSNGSERQLVFSNFRGGYYDVTFTGRSISVSTSVYSPADLFQPDHLFQELAQFDRPWSGEKKWESIEGEFGIAVTCDALGHVLITVKMHIELWSDNEWSHEKTQVTAGLTVDFGALPATARDAQAFFVSER